MAKKLKTIIAGPFRKEVLYTAPEPHDSPAARAQKSRATSEAQRIMNRKTSREKLKLTMYTNFTGRDLFITLTYRDTDMPAGWKRARELVRKFLRNYRNARKKRGQSLKYIYVTEGKHGDHRLHHHLVINATGQDIEEIRSLWTYGDVVDVEYIGERGIKALSAYMTKESMEGGPVGAQAWTPSRGMKKPTIKTVYVPNNTTLKPPLNCHIMDREIKEKEFGGYAYYEYYIFPPWENPEKAGCGACLTCL